MTMLDDALAMLAQYPAPLRAVGPLEPLGNAGGLSGARLWRFVSGRGPLVLRAWPREGRGREVLEQVHRWLAETAQLAFVPIPLRTLYGRTLPERNGQLWELAGWKPGAPECRPPIDQTRLRNGMAGLAAFHQCLSHHGKEAPSPGIERRVRELTALASFGFGSLGDAMRRLQPNDLTSLAERWAALARPLVPRVQSSLLLVAGHNVPLQPCLRDARAEHFLFEGDRLSGLVDFGAMDVDTVAGDLARLLPDWAGDDRQARAIALESYCAVRPLSELETRLIEAFESAADILIGAHWVRWGILEERWFDDPAAVRNGLERGIERLERLGKAHLR